MTRALADMLTAQLAAEGIDETQLDDADYRYVETKMRSVLTGLKARRTWENHLGPLLSHADTLALTGWSKQALSQAVRTHRVLRVLDENGTAAYVAAGFDDDHPARPLPGIKPVLTAWSAADPRGWAAASWLASPQVELDGRTPRDALLAGDTTTVSELARQATVRLAA